MLSRVKRGIQIARHFSNSREVYRHILLGQPLSRISLREGLVLQAPENVNLWNHFNDIWLHQVYTADGFQIKHGSTVVDVGANIGLFSIMAARTAAKVFSFEPFAPTFDYLRRNIRTNHLEQIKAFNYAVGAQATSRVLHIQPESTANSLYTGRGRPDGQEIVVKCTSLPELFEANRLERVDFLKLDCEGSEFEIIFGTPRECLSRCDVISMECHDGVTDHSWKDLKLYLEAAGYITAVGKIYGNTTIVKARKRWVKPSF